MYHGRNLYITNIFNYTHLNFKIFNNNVNNTNRSLPISGIAYKLDGDFPSKNFTHKIHHKSGPEAHTIKLVFFPLIFLFMVTISNWIRKETFSYYTSKNINTYSLNLDDILVNTARFSSFKSTLISPCCAYI